MGKRDSANKRKGEEVVQINVKEGIVVPNSCTEHFVIRANLMDLIELECVNSNAEVLKLVHTN